MNSWDKTVKFLEKEVPGFKIKIKEDSKFQKFLGKITFWMDYMSAWTTLYPNVWKSKKTSKRTSTLQHEGVHDLDAQTLFGIFPNLPVLRWFCVGLFYLLYASPQALAILAVLSFLSPWWLLSLALLTPIPAPFRMIAEMRAYRRSVELGRDPEEIAEKFINSTYYFMWPFKKHVIKQLKKPSPYREKMDKIIGK